MVTVAQIASTAFTAAAAQVTDAVVDVTVTRYTQGAYNATTGAYSLTSSQEAGQAVLDMVKPVNDIFPTFVIGPKDQLWLIRGITTLQEGDKVTIAAADYRVAAVQDILAAGSLFYAVLQ